MELRRIPVYWPDRKVGMYWPDRGPSVIATLVIIIPTAKGAQAL